MNNNKKFNQEEEDEEEESGRGQEAWERTYAEDRSWESLQEDESGLLRPIDNKSLSHAQYRRRLRTATTARIQKGLIRYLYIVIDFSRAATEMDYKPSRMVVVAKQVEAFIREFFDQNPLSQIGLVTLKDGVAHCLTDLGGSPEAHIKALMGKLGSSGSFKRVGIGACPAASSNCRVCGGKFDQDGISPKSSRGCHFYLFMSLRG